jgi:hypothetical protein
MRKARSITAVVIVLVTILGAGVAWAASSSPQGSQDASAGATTVRELAALRTADSDTYLLSDGTRAVKIYPHPINYRTASGAYDPIDDQLVVGADGSWSPRASKVAVSLPADPAAAPTTLGSGASALSFALEGANHGLGLINGASRIYGGILPGVSATYTAGPDALRETLTLTDGSSPSTYTYHLTLGRGMRALQTAGGGILVENGTGKALYRIPAPVVFDASHRTLPQTAPAHYELSRDGKTLTLVIDPAWLQSSRRVFPVTVDPDVFFNEEEDCLIGSPASANTNLCGAPLYVGTGEGSPKEIARAMLHFDLSSIPTDAEILKSRLALWFEEDSTATTIPIEARALTHSFDSGATWNTYDGTHNWTTSGGDLAAEAAGETEIKDSYKGWWVNWGFTPQVQRWVQDGSTNDGILLKAHNESATGFDVFAQNDNGEGAPEPNMEVVYEAKLGDDGGTDRMLTTQEVGNEETANVNVANGNLLLTSSDVNYGEGEYETKVTRNWNSLDDELVTSSFGDAWRLNMGEDTLLYPAWWDQSEVFHEPGGMYARFDRKPSEDNSPSAGDKAFEVPSETNLTLIRHASGTRSVTFNETGVKWEFDASENGFPQKIVDPNGEGNTISMNYTSSRLTGVKDTHGHELTLTRSPTSHYVTKIKSTTGETWEYTYEGGLLTKVKAPSSAETTYSYGAHDLITEIVNSTGTYVISYDGQLRATEIRKLVNGTVATPGGEDETTGLSYKTPEGPVCNTERDAGETVVTYGPGEQPTTTYCYNAAGEETAYSDGEEEEEEAEFEEQPEVPSCYNAELYCGEEDPPGENEEYEEEGGFSPFAATIPPDLPASHYGISDNNRVKEGSPHFDYLDNAWFEALHVKKVRRIVPWNIVPAAAGGGVAAEELADVKAWAEKVKAKGAEPFISFQYCEHNWMESGVEKKCKTQLPSNAVYKQAIEEFLKYAVLKEINSFTAWNEPNNPVQPTWTDGERAGEYWREFDELCRPANYKCRVAAGDFLDSNMKNAKNAGGEGGPYIRAYIKGMNHRAAQWAWHAYSDGRQTVTKYAGKPSEWWGRFNRFREEIDRASKKHPDVWLSEQGVVFSNNGKWEPAHKDDNGLKIMHAFVAESRHPADQLTRQSRQIVNFFYYQMRGEEFKTEHQDSGLLDPVHSKPRSIYYVYRGKTN